MTDKQKTILIFSVASVLIVIAAILAWSINRNTAQEELPNGDYIPTDGIPTRPSVSGTVGPVTATQLPGGSLLIRNNREAYQIIVPPDWMMEPEGIEEVLQFYFSDRFEIPAETEVEDDVGILTIKVLSNPEKYSFDDWFNSLDIFTAYEIGNKNNYKPVNVDQGVFRSSRKLDDINDYGNVAAREDSSLVDYLFFADTKIYRVSCSAAGVNYAKFIQECEVRMQTFLIE